MKSPLLISFALLSLIACGTSKNKKKSAPVAEELPPVVELQKDDKKAEENPQLGEQGTVKEGQAAKTDGKVSKNPPAETPTQNTTVPKDCELVVLDFEKKENQSYFELGEKVKEQYRHLGVRIEAYKREKPDQKWDQLTPTNAIIFDSALQPDAATRELYYQNSKRFGNENGFDDDLLVGKHGNLLIIAENEFDLNPNDGIDRVSFPDDNGLGGKIKLYFDKPTRVLSMDTIAFSNKDSKIELWDVDGQNWSLKASQAIPESPANSSQTLTVSHEGYVAKLKVYFASGGALDNIRLCVKK